MLSGTRIDMLWDCFIRKLSSRVAALEAGVDRKTVLRYFRRFERSGPVPPKPPKRKKKALPVKNLNISPGSWARIEIEASERTLSARELVSEVINTVARDRLFSAIIDN